MLLQTCMQIIYRLLPELSISFLSRVAQDPQSEVNVTLALVNLDSATLHLSVWQIISICYMKVFPFPHKLMSKIK